jgi:hypothetical protein
VADQQGADAVAVTVEEEEEEGEEGEGKKEEEVGGGREEREARRALLEFVMHGLKKDLFPELMDLLW